MGTKTGAYSSDKPFHESTSQTVNGPNGGAIKRKAIDMDAKVDADVRATRGFSAKQPRS